MDSAKIGTFFLGLVAAAVLFMLWRKESRSNGGCASCNAGLPCNGGCGMPGQVPMSTPSCAASAAIQNALNSVGLAGQISPTTAPLNAVTGGGGRLSFYTIDGVTPDPSFTFQPVPRNTTDLGSPVQPGGLQGNVPGSPTTPSYITPVRATQPVPSYYEDAFVPRYSIAGIYVH